MVEKIICDNHVLFHHVARTLSYVDIKTIVVSCGLCYRRVQIQEFGKMFVGSCTVDIHAYFL